MTDQDFDFVRKFLAERSGLALDADKRYLVESRLGPLAKRLDLPTLTDLIARLRAGTSAELQADVIDAMVTTETSFFRDLHPFETLRRTVLPELLAKRRDQRQLNIWCAATSSGQEPYSLLMLLRDSFPELHISRPPEGWRVSFLSTDISREMLARSRDGLYNQVEVNRGLPANLLVKYFEQQHVSGSARTGWRIRQELRSAIEFREMNLTRAWPVLPPMDLIMMRNVMIYFDTPTKQAILRKVARVLKPDGYLLLGGTETTFNVDDGFQRVEGLKTGFFRLTS